MLFTLLGIGLGLQAYGQIQQGRAAKKAGQAQQEIAESEATLAEFNAAVAATQAKDAVERGVEQEGIYRQQVQGVIGEQRAGFAGANVDVGFGSAVDVVADAAYLGELDALTIRTNAAREAWGYQVQEVDLKQRAIIARKGGSYAAQAGAAEAAGHYIGAAGSIATGVGSILATKYGFDNAGAGRAPKTIKSTRYGTVQSGRLGYY